MSPDDLDVLPAKDAGAQEFSHSFLGREARREVQNRPSAPGTVVDLGSREQPVAKPGVALESALESADIDQIEPDARGMRRNDERPIFTRRIHVYSTVTVLARLRGWSTFSPRQLAT